MQRTPRAGEGLLHPRHQQRGEPYHNSAEGVRL